MCDGSSGGIRPPPHPLCLEQEFRADLQDSRIPCLRYQAKGTRVDFSPGVHKLRVIKDIEALQPQLQFLGFRNPRSLQQCHVEVIQAGAMEEAPPRIAKNTQLFVAEKRSIEVGFVVSRVGVGQYRPPTRAHKSIERHKPVVAKDKVLVYIEVAKRFAERRIEWIG